MKFLYVTDLHGHVEKYETVLKYALEHKIKLLHIGADILPKGAGMQKKQKKFIKGYLKNFYAECGRNGIRVMAFFGNDDLYTRKHAFGEYGDLLDELPYRQNGYTFKAYSYVPDHCFALKNGTKLDSKNSKPVKLWPRLMPVPSFLSDDLVRVPVTPAPVDIGQEGIYEITDLEKYFREKGTIEDDLKSIRVGSKTIMAIHSPPAGCGLDVCLNGKKVGSKSVYAWI